MQGTGSGRPVDNPVVALITSRLSNAQGGGAKVSELPGRLYLRFSSADHLQKVTAGKQPGKHPDQRFAASGHDPGKALGAEGRPGPAE